jgi:glycosyltransferase involved in cell wall biosynthesis
MIKFSIITPCYNLENHIEKTIESVLKQTYKYFELIIIDDGSKDNSLDIIRKNKNKDNRIKVFSKENGGVSSARNFGIGKAQGEYIFFLDGDDLIENDLLEKAQEVFKQKNVDMFSYGYKKTNTDITQVIKKYSFEKHDKQIFTGPEFQKLFFSRKIAQHMCSFIVKKCIILDNSIRFDENTKYAEDQEFQLRCNINCKSIYYESKEFFYYIQREGSAVNQKIVRDNFDVYFRMEHYLSKDLKQSYNNYLCYSFVTDSRNVALKGSEKSTVKKLLSMDYVLEHLTLDNTKHNLLTWGFILFYRVFYKKYIKKKYKIK